MFISTTMKGTWNANSTVEDVANESNASVIDPIRLVYDVLFQR